MSRHVCVLLWMEGGWGGGGRADPNFAIWVKMRRLFLEYIRDIHTVHKFKYLNEYRQFSLNVSDRIRKRHRQVGKSRSSTVPGVPSAKTKSHGVLIFCFQDFDWNTSLASMPRSSR